jgi:hypothetical protein
MAPGGFCNISADIPIESPSAINASSPSGTARFPSYGVIMQMGIAKKP